MEGRVLTMHTIIVKNNYLRWLHELLFSLNAALLVVWVASLRTRIPVIFVGRRLLFWFYRYSHLSVPSFLRVAEPNSQYFLMSVLAGAVVLFLGLRFQARFAVMNIILRTVAGVFAVLGLPLASLYLGEALIEPALAHEELLFCEMTALAVGICVYKYKYRVLPFKDWLGIFILVLHFCLWGWATWNRMWFWIVYPVVGCGSSVVWVLYLKQSRETQETAVHLGTRVEQLL